MQRVILDTNFLLYCLKEKVDLFGELNRILNVNYEVCVLDKTLDELKGKKDGKLALQFAEKYFKVIKSKLFWEKSLSKKPMEKSLSKNKCSACPYQPSHEKSLKGKPESVDDLLLKQDAIVATMDKELKEKLKKGKKQVIVLRQKKYLIFY